MSKIVKLLPAASRTVNALSELAYTLESAICDILDNSITRGKCSNIYISFSKNSKLNDDLSIIIADDGNGMLPKILEEAMREGGETGTYGKNDLSKYGMGLKTASLSQAKTITVLSKDYKSQFPSAYTKCRNLIDQHNDWVVEKHDHDDIKKLKKRISNFGDYYINKKILKSKSYTLVFWEDLWAINKSYCEIDSSVKKVAYHSRLLNKLEKYIGTIFHRYLEGEQGLKKIKIFLNEIEIKAIDPLCLYHEHTLELDFGNSARFSVRNGVMPIEIKGVVLPCSPKTGGKCFNTEKEYTSQKSPNKSLNDSQGYYIYRNKRLINWGGWFRTRQRDEHLKLARVRIDLTEEHDEDFTLELKKTKLEFPHIFIEFLKDSINKKILPIAKERYDGKEGSVTSPKSEFRNKKKMAADLARNLIKEDRIDIDEVYDFKTKKVKLHQVTNPNGVMVKTFDDSINFDPNLVQDHHFGNDNELWRLGISKQMFHVQLNKDHPFYEYIYDDPLSQQKVRAIMEAFAFTFCFAELKCVTDKNRYLFDQIREVISDTLKKQIEINILTK